MVVVNAAPPLRAVVLAQHEGLRKSIVAPLKADGMIVVEVAAELDAYRDFNRGVPDLVVMQATSEAGEDREALLVGMLSTPHRPPVIVVTGDSGADVASKLVRRGAYCTLRAPVDPEEVRVVARRAIRERERSREREGLILDLEAMRNHVQDTLLNMLDGVVVIDTKDTVLFANGEGARILLQDPTKIVGMKLDPRFCWSIFNLLKKARESGLGLAEEEFELMSGDKARLRLRARTSLIHDHSKSIVGALIVMRDLTPAPGAGAKA